MPKNIEGEFGFKKPKGFQAEFLTSSINKSALTPKNAFPYFEFPLLILQLYL